MKPMLARTYGPKYNRFPCYVQPKLNGVRALYQQGIFQSRDEKLWHPSILEHLRREFASIDLGDTILDGELYVHGWRLQRINGAIAVNRTSPREDTHLVEYHVFDVVNPHETFSERWLTLRYGLLESGATLIKVVDTALAHDRLEVEQHFHRYTSQGYEGIMLRPDGPYDFGRTAHGTEKRSQNLWKYKQWQDGEFICVGITQGEGKADIGIGALVCLANKGEEFLESPFPYGDPQIITAYPKFSVGTGFTDEERMELMLCPPIGRLVKIRYLELTADGIPSNTSFLCVM